MMEPELYAELLEQFRNVFRQIVPRHGGEIVRIDGDGVLCIFGHPVPFEDAGRRAAEAAVDLHTAMMGLDQAYDIPDASIRLHTGIHAGVVLLRTGDEVRGRYEILGDVTNIAARLCDLAEPGRILVSEETLGAERLFFRTGARRVVKVRGAAKGLAIFDILGRDEVGTRLAARTKRGVAPFIGRERELEQLGACLKRAEAGEHCFAVIFAAAGMGKTRLLDEFLDLAVARGAKAHRSYCEAYLGAGYVQPFAQLLSSILEREYGISRQSKARHITAVLHSIDPQCVRPIMSLFGRHTADKTNVETMIAGIVTFLKSMHTPMILSIDDWQWADDASRAVFESSFLDPKFPHFFVLATREIDGSTQDVDGGEAIRLQPLSGTQSMIVIEHLAAASDPFQAARIAKLAGGSPLFLEELCHAITTHDGHLGDEESNAWLDMLIQSRFLKLSDDDATLVKTAAVIGHMIPAWLFESITGVTSGNPALNRLMAADFIYAAEVPGTLRFKHGITRDVIYRTVGMRERMALHLRVAEALRHHHQSGGGDEPLAALGHHYRAGGDLESAFGYILKAGDRALAAAALDRAQANYRAALEMIGDSSGSNDKVRLLSPLIHKFGLASIVDPSPEQLPVLASALSLSEAQGNVEAQRRSRYWLGSILYGVGRAGHSIALLEKAAHLSTGAFSAQIKASLGQSYFAFCRYPEAERELDNAIAMMLEQRAPRAMTGLSYAIGSRALMNADRGKFDLAEQDFNLAEDVLGGTRPAMLGSLFNKRAAFCIWRGRFEEAIRYAEAGIEHGMATRSRYYIVMSRALSGYSAWQLDHDPANLAMLEKATNWFLKGESHHRTSLCHGWMADVMAQIGDAKYTRLWASRAFRRARAGDRLGEAVAARALARVEASTRGRRGPEHYLGIAARSAALRLSQREAAETYLCASELGLAEPIAAPEPAQLSKEFLAMGMTRQAKRADALLRPIANR